MPMFRARSTPVEAILWDGELATEVRLQRWLGYAFIHRQGDEILIENRSGRVVARLGDWIADLGDGFYPVEPKLLAAACEQVSP